MMPTAAEAAVHGLLVFICPACQQCAEQCGNIVISFQLTPCMCLTAADDVGLIQINTNCQAMGSLPSLRTNTSPGHLHMLTPPYLSTLLFLCFWSPSLLQVYSHPVFQVVEAAIKHKTGAERVNPVAQLSLRLVYVGFITMIGEEA